MWGPEARTQRKRHYSKRVLARGPPGPLLPGLGGGEQNSSKTWQLQSEPLKWKGGDPTQGRKIQDSVLGYPGLAFPFLVLHPLCSFLDSWLGQKAGGDGLVGRSCELGVRRHGSQLVLATAPNSGPGEPTFRLGASILPSQHSKRAHFLDADKRNCTFGGGGAGGGCLYSKTGAWFSTQRTQGETSSGTGGLPTTVSLVQAVGAVLDPVAGGHTQSVHRAEERSRAGCTGRVPSGHASSCRHVQTRCACVLAPKYTHITCAHVHAPVCTLGMDRRVQAHVHSTHTGLYERVCLLNTGDSLAYGGTRQATGIKYTHAHAHTYAHLQSFDPASWCFRGWEGGREKLQGHRGRPPCSQAAHTHDRTGCTSRSAPARQAR